MSEWPRYSLADLCEDVSYGYTASASDDRSLPRLLRITDIVPDSIDWRTVPGCEISEEEESKHALRKGDIVVARTGATVGYAKRIRDEVRAVPASYLVRFRPSQNVNPSFLGFVIESDAYKAYVKSNAGGAAQPNANAKVLGSFILGVPDIRTQGQISSILGAIDDLIENNRRRIEILEEMAQAIYREWFVHFRFPGHETVTFVDSPLGPIPENWEFRTLEQLAHLTMGQSPKSEFYNESGEGHPFHQGVKDFGRHFPTHRTFCTVEGRQAKSGDILISVRAPVGRLNIAPSDLTIGRGLATARARSGAQALLFYGLKMTAFAVEDSIGSGTIFKAITRSDLANLRIPWPTSEIQNQASSVLDSMMDQIRALTSWNTGLSSTRELLLPKLVSGEIDVSDFDLDAVFEEAV